MTYCTCGMSGSVWCAGLNCYAVEEEENDDVCLHGRAFDEICIDCCPEDDDGSFDGDEWS
jgi:hypothetical protein